MIFKCEIFEGILEQVGNAANVDGRMTKYSFLKIGGRIVKNVEADNFLSSFLEAGEYVRISVRTSIFGRRALMAVQESDGAIQKLGMDKMIFALITIPLMFLALWAVALAALSVIFDSNRLLSLDWAALFALGYIINTFSIIRSMFKARSILDKQPPMPVIDPS